MAEGDIKRIVQIGQNTLTPQQINEAFRQVSTWVNLLEGRSGLIELRDGIQSLTSGSQAFANTSQNLRDASFGVFYSGVNGTDCWLASGAKLVGENEWVALKTRAAMLKLSNSAGPISYFNTGLTPGTSFIPIAQSTGPGTPRWGNWLSTVVSPNYGPEKITWDVENYADPAYFLRQNSDTEILILVDGLYEVTTTVSFSMDDTTLNSAQIDLEAGSFGYVANYADPSTIGTIMTSTCSITNLWSISAGQIVYVNRLNAAPDVIGTVSRILTIKLIQS